MDTAAPPIEGPEPSFLVEYRRRRAERRRTLMMALAPVVLVLGVVGWTAIRHVIATAMLEWRSIRVDWQVGRHNWGRGGSSGAEAAPGVLGMPIAVRADDLRYLGWLRHLHRLDLSRLDRFDDEELAGLSGLTDLNVLILDRTYSTGWLDRGPRPRPTDAGVAHLKGLTGLRELTLAGFRLTDAGVAHLTGLVDLETLDLRATEITDAGLEPLKRLGGLKYLNVRETRVTKEGVTAFRAAMPHTDVDCEWPAPGAPGDPMLRRR